MGCRSSERRTPQRALARRWLERFGPGTVEDLQWWTGWNKTSVRRALSRLRVEEVDLHGETGIALRAVDDDFTESAADTAVAALLPSLDPTPMGWKRRDWFLGIDHHYVFDNNGNIGPTLWWDGGDHRVLGNRSLRGASHRRGRRQRGSGRRRCPKSRLATSRTSPRRSRHPGDPHTSRAVTRSGCRRAPRSTIGPQRPPARADERYRIAPKTRWASQTLSCEEQLHAGSR